MAVSPEMGYSSPDSKDVEKKADLTQVQSSCDGQILEASAHGTKRAIKSRHAHMIAIGGSVGTSLFVASGQALAAGGPALLLISYLLLSLMVYGIVTAVIEVSAKLITQIPPSIVLPTRTQ
jgi:yeast amino acid transporter